MKKIISAVSAFALSCSLVTAIRTYEADAAVTVTTSYEWAVAPEIDAQDIIVSDLDELSYDAKSFDDVYPSGAEDTAGYSVFDYAVMIDDGTPVIIDYEGNMAEGGDGFDQFFISKGKITVRNSEEGSPAADTADAGYTIDAETGKAVNKITGLPYSGENCIIAEKDGEFFTADKNGIVPGSSGYAKGFMNYSNTNGITAFRDGSWGYFGADGKCIIDFSCEPVGICGDTFCTQDSYWLSSSANTEYTRDELFENGRVYMSSGGYIPVKRDGSYGYYDTKGNEVIPVGTFEEARPVHNGHAWVKDAQTGLWGVISIKQEKTVTYEIADVDGDGTIDPADASTVLQEYSARMNNDIPVLSDEQSAAADVNKDNTVDASDASIILSYYAYTMNVGSDPFDEWFSKGGEAGETTTTTTSSTTTETTTTTTTTTAPAHVTEVINGVTYIDGILIANKTYALPSTYNPGGLTAECLEHFNQLRAGAARDGLNIYISSGFRSYSSQAQIYQNYVWRDGQAKADTYSARPGHSEHQTGLAIDVNEISDRFIGTPEAIWLAAHAHEYGFIIRYPYGKDDITGYKYEPWHIRYIGVDNAKKVYESGLTLEEYLGIDSYYH